VKQRFRFFCHQGHEAQLICNWLLHYINSFNYFESEGKLEDYKNVQNTIRYNFGDNFSMREELTNISNNLVNSLNSINSSITNELFRTNQHLNEIKYQVSELKPIESN